LGNLLLQRLDRRDRQTGKISGLVDEAGRLVLDLLDLVVDLLQRPGGGQYVLRVVAGVIRGAPPSRIGSASARWTGA
jgi:hypothetical protein